MVKNAIVRQIWGNADTILFIFGGAAAEFSLNKAVDWLYFTGKLPADPLGRLFSTVVYAQQILFLDEATSHLDVALEHGVNQSIQHLNMTRVIIAHRPDTIRSAQRVIVVTAEGVVEQVVSTSSPAPSPSVAGSYAEQNYSFNVVKTRESPE